MQVNFKVYPRKINIFVDTSSNIPVSERQRGKPVQWTYLHSTNAYPTCRAAIAALNPEFKYKAWFAK